MTLAPPGTEMLDTIAEFNVGEREIVYDWEIDEWENIVESAISDETSNIDENQVLDLIGDATQWIDRVNDQQLLRVSDLLDRFVDDSEDRSENYFMSLNTIVIPDICCAAMDASGKALHSPEIKIREAAISMISTAGMSQDIVGQEWKRVQILSEALYDEVSFGIALDYMRTRLGFRTEEPISSLYMHVDEVKAEADPLYENLDVVADHLADPNEKIQNLCLDTLMIAAQLEGSMGQRLFGVDTKQEDILNMLEEQSAQTVEILIRTVGIYLDVREKMLLERLITGSDPSSVFLGLQRITGDANKTDSFRINLIKWLDPEIRIKEEEEKRFKTAQIWAINGYMRSLNLPKELFECLETWEIGYDKSATGHSRVIENNLTAMTAIERSVPGGCKLLFEQYGIRHFGRYPLEVLINQVVHHGEDIHEIKIINPYYDHNGAFYNRTDKTVLKSLHNETLKDGDPPKYIVRIHETDSAKEALHAINEVKRAIASGKRKNGIAVIKVGGHGSEAPGSLELGLANESGKEFGRTAIDTTEMKQVTEGIDPAWDKENKAHPISNGRRPVLIANSCFSGQEGNTVQEMSRILKCVGIGPTVPCWIKEVDLKRDEKGDIVDASVTYETDGKPPMAFINIPTSQVKRYVDGKPV